MTPVQRKFIILQTARAACRNRCLLISRRSVLWDTGDLRLHITCLDGSGSGSELLLQRALLAPRSCGGSGGGGTACSCPVPAAIPVPGVWMCPQLLGDGWPGAGGVAGLRCPCWGAGEGAQRLFRGGSPPPIATRKTSPHPVGSSRREGSWKWGGPSFQGTTQGMFQPCPRSPCTSICPGSAGKG